MPATIILKALGLSTSPNQLSDKDGSLLQASNIVIRRDNVIEPRRGFQVYGESLGSTSDTCKQLLTYQNQLLRHYDTTIDYDTGVLGIDGLNIFQALAGSYTEQSPGLRIKSVISNGNLYFTTSAGIQKLSVKQGTGGLTPNTLITPAGGVKAIDLQARLNVYQGQETGFFPEDSQTSYRAVWALNDPNNNLIQGTPSQRFVISNSMLQLLIMDFDKLVSTLDDLNQSGSLFNFGNYVGSPTPVTVSTTFTTTANSPTVTVTSATGIVPGMAISSVGVTSAPVGAIVFKVSGTTVTLNQNASASVTTQAVSFTSPAYEVVSATGGTSALRSNLVALAIKMDQNLQWGSNVAPAANTAPLQLLTAGIVITASPTNLATFTFNSGNPSLYISPGDIINLQGFTTTAGAINGPQTVISVTNTTLAFRPTDLTAASLASTATPGTIESYNYRNLVNSTTLPTPAVIPTHGDLLNIQKAWQNIIGRIGVEKTAVLSTALQTAYINTLQSTTAANVNVDITIPSAVVTAYNQGIFYFLQLYRSTVQTASNVGGSTDILGVTVVADDEDHLVYEGYPTQANITAQIITILDITPDALAGADLYTNEITGEGAIQANDLPPFALDINRFENYIFFANTKTRFRQNLNLLGVSNITAGTSTFTITDGTTTNTYTYNTGTYQTRTILCDAVGNIATGAKFDLTSDQGNQQYFVWFDKTGSDTPPVVSGRVAIRVNLNEYVPGTTSLISTAAQVAVKLFQTLSGYPIFTTTLSGSTLTVTNANYGTINSPNGTVNNDVTTNNGFSGAWTFTITVIGGGENAVAKEFLLSPNISPSLAVDETARSMVRVINQNPNEIVYAYYITGTQLVPGGILLESRSISNNAFYVLTNGITTTQIGSSFVPNLSATNTITGISIANPTVITSAAHGLTTLNQIVISGSNSAPSIDGVYTVTVLSANTFSIPVNVTGSGNAGAFALSSAVTLADNEVKPNRLYYSKVSQPEAVPITNYLDVGAETKAILRIFPLRDTLFVLKEDGCFRVSGSTAPFSESLFDTSCVLVCPDSVSIANNLIYGYTIQGIQTISEAGVSIISRNIDNVILPLNSGQYTNFQTASWGVGYDADNAYHFNTVQQVGDKVATICYRYCNLTTSWTTWNKTNTCGIINPLDGKLYMGAGDINFIESERKNFDRTDYADRQYTVNLALGSYLQSGQVLALDNTSHAAPGDVLLQTQTLTIYEYNALLNKMDAQLSQSITGNLTLNSNQVQSVSSTTGLAIGQVINTSGLPVGTTITNIVGSTLTVSNLALNTQTGAVLNASRYFTALQATGGDNMRSDLVALTTKLDSDPNVTGGTYTSNIQSLSATLPASAMSATMPTIITSTAHGLAQGRIINISGSNSTPSINGEWQVNVLTANTFSIPVNVSLVGSASFTYVTADQDFRDIEACYNATVAKLNSDPKNSSPNFTQITATTQFESIITAVNQATRQVTLLTPLQYVVGPLTLFKTIPTQFQYTPITMQDVLGYKHLRESQVIFETQAFTSATVSFASDLQPAFVDVPITGQGNGIYGMNTYGNGYYGGAGNSAPFRTYIPRNAQRCRFLLVRFFHSIAREKYSINGITVTGEIGQSSRAYR